jgi:1-deoxy-D-xylulose 5-phosphate reductoisomerase
MRALLVRSRFAQSNRLARWSLKIVSSFTEAFTLVQLNGHLFSARTRAGCAEFQPQAMAIGRSQATSKVQFHHRPVKQRQ